MERIIKFRALFRDFVWNVERLTFYNNGIESKLLRTDDNLNIIEVTAHTADGLQLMQYTGIRDINNKEIYEGNVVSDPFGFTGSVKYSDDGRFVVTPDKSESWKYKHGDDFPISEDQEIIAEHILKIYGRK